MVSKLNSGKNYLFRRIFSVGSLDALTQIVLQSCKNINNYFACHELEEIGIESIIYKLTPVSFQFSSDKNEMLSIDALALYMYNYLVQDHYVPANEKDYSFKEDYPNYNALLKALYELISTQQLDLDLSNYKPIQLEKLILRPYVAVVYKSAIPLGLIYENISPSANISNRYIILPATGNYLENINSLFTLERPVSIVKHKVNEEYSSYSLYKYIMSEIQAGIKTVNIDNLSKETLLEDMEKVLTVHPKLQGASIPDTIKNTMTSKDVLAYIAITVKLAKNK